MDERPKEFPQTGADGSGQVSPQLGSFWLPNQNGGLPDGMTPDFSVPRYEEGVSDIYIPDYHPPERIPDHPFKVNRYFDVQDEQWKIRVREGRFYLTTNDSATVPAGGVTVLGPSGGPNEAADTANDTGVTLADIFPVNGDDGFPSFGNDAVYVSPTKALAEEFTNSDAAHGYANLTSTSTYFDPEQVNYVHLRYVLKYSTTGIELSGETNDLNIISVIEEDKTDTTTGAANRPIAAAAIVDKNDNAADPDLQIMRADPDPVIPATMNKLATGGSSEDRLRFGVYYILLAKIEPTGKKTGPIVTQYIHSDIYLSVSNLAVTAYSEGFGEEPE